MLIHRHPPPHRRQPDCCALGASHPYQTTRLKALSRFARGCLASGPELAPPPPSMAGFGLWIAPYPRRRLRRRGPETNDHLKCTTKVTRCGERLCLWKAHDPIYPIVEKKFHNRLEWGKGRGGTDSREGVGLDMFIESYITIFSRKKKNGKKTCAEPPKKNVENIVCLYNSPTSSNCC